MASGFNWARARMQKIIAERGFEPVSHGLPREQRGRTRRGRPSSHPPELQRLLSEFRALPVDGRALQAKEFRHRLRAISGSESEAESRWKKHFERGLGGLRPGETLAEAASGMREAARDYRARRAAQSPPPTKRKSTAPRKGRRRKR
jgi:hypothetical protein